MDDLEKQLRRHYEGQWLANDRVQEILALGRAAGEARAGRAWWRLAAAAVVLLGLGIFGATAFLRVPGGPPSLAVQSVASTVVNYLSDPAHKMPVVSADHGVLVEWLRQHGGPAGFHLPPAMTGLASLGCHVIEVRGQKVFIMCFFLDASPTDIAAGSAPERKMMATGRLDGPAVQTARPLVHLVVAPKAMFSAPPQTGDPVVLPLEGNWNFAMWGRGDQVYLIVAALPTGQLASLVAAI